MFEVVRTASASTALTCNCLLPAPWLVESSTTHKTVDVEDVAGPTYSFHAASYELLQHTALTTAQEAENVEEPKHAGECATYNICALGAAAGNNSSNSSSPCRTLQQQCCTTSVTGAPLMPGVFDLVSVPASFVRNFYPYSVSSHYLMMACTDSSVRLVNPFTLANAVDSFTNIHEEMITSCTPVYVRVGEENTPHLLCSAHTGAVVVYSLQERRVTQELEGHEFDAWCTAVIPTGGCWNAPPPFTSGDGAVDEDRKGQADASASAALLASGGDDGLCKLYDVRCDSAKATSRMCFDAGVVSITPVLDTSCHGVAACSTPYILVGSYDESISLVDVRSMRRPVARREKLGGGVWRTSRYLRPLWNRAEAFAVTPDTDANLALMLENASASTLSKAAVPSSSSSCGWVNTANVLVLPLMQRGAALLPYDVRASTEEVFGNSPLTYFFAEQEEETGVRDSANDKCPTLTEKSLIYDTAVLRLLTGDGDNAAAVVATTSFYEKRIDLWSVRRAQFA